MLFICFDYIWQMDLEKLKTLRKIKNLTQEEMADSLGISQTTYARNENGKIALSPQRLDEIARILGVNVSFLLSENDSHIIANESENLMDSYLNERSYQVQKLRLDIVTVLKKEVEFLKSQNLILSELLQKCVGEK